MDDPLPRQQLVYSYYFLRRTVGEMLVFKIA
jgi:hypothetical protein